MDALPVPCEAFTTDMPQRVKAAQVELFACGGSNTYIRSQVISKSLDKQTLPAQRRACLPSHRHLILAKQVAKDLTWERVNGEADAQVLSRNHAQDGRVDLVHVQGDAVQSAVVALFFAMAWEGRDAIELMQRTTNND